MNCKSFRARQAELFDINPDPAATADLLAHIAGCPGCAREYEEALGVLAALRPSKKLCASPNTKEQIMDRVADIDTNRRLAAPWWSRGRRVWAGAVVALVLMAVVGISMMTKGGPALSTLAQAAEFFDGVKSMHIVANMRTVAHDNFDFMKLDAPLIPIEIWTENSDPPKWRVEKEHRFVTNDGDTTTLLIDSGAGKFARREDGAAKGMVGWLESLLDVGRLFDHERELAAKQGSQIDVEYKTGSDGRSKTILAVRAKAQGDFSESDFSKNTSVAQSDNIRIYAFDSETQRLEKLSVLVQTPKGNVLVFDTTRIEYDKPVASSLFALDIPADATWIKDPSELPTTPDTSRMTPDAAARKFFEACAKSDWDGALVFAGSLADNPRLQDYLGGLTLISIGKPFKSGQYPGWFVPYEIRLKSGETKKFNLAVRNDTPKGLWMVDGGI